MSANQFTTCPHCGQQFPLKKAFSSKTIALPTTLHSTATTLPKAQLPEQGLVRQSFWQSDGVVYGLAATFAGLMTLTAGAWYEFDYAGLTAAVLAVSTGIGLHLLKIILHAPARPAAPSTGAVTIKIEQRGTDENPRGLRLDSIQDESISLDDLRRVARAVEAGCAFSRPALTVRAGISQRKYSKIKSEFERLNYCYTDKGNKTHLLRAGMAFLRAIE